MCQNIEIFKRVRQKVSQPLVARCDVEFLQDADPEGETEPSCPEDGKSYYWSTITERWVVMDRPKCEDVPVFVYPGNETYPDQLVFCPLGLQLLNERANVKELKAKSVSDIAGTFIDVLAVSPPSWIFRSLLQTRQVGQCKFFSSYSFLPSFPVSFLSLKSHLEVHVNVLV